MHVSVISYASGPLFRIDDGTFVIAAANRWPGKTRILRDPDDPFPVTVQIEDPGDPSFQLLLSAQGDHVMCEGTGSHMGESALWVRSLIPDDPGGEIWMIDEGFNGHAVLQPGMTLDDLNRAWVDHDDNPPDLSVFETT